MSSWFLLTLNRCVCVVCTCKPYLTSHCTLEITHILYILDLDMSFRSLCLFLAFLCRYLLTCILSHACVFQPTSKSKQSSRLQGGDSLYIVCCADQLGIVVRIYNQTKIHCSLHYTVVWCSRLCSAFWISTAECLKWHLTCYGCTSNDNTAKFHFCCSTYCMFLNFCIILRLW